MQILILKHGIGYVAYSADSVRWQERKRAQLPDRARELGITCIKCLQSNLLNPPKNILRQVKKAAVVHAFWKDLTKGFDRSSFEISYDESGRKRKALVVRCVDESLRQKYS